MESKWICVIKYIYLYMCVYVCLYIRTYIFILLFADIEYSETNYISFSAVPKWDCIQYLYLKTEASLCMAISCNISFTLMSKTRNVLPLAILN